MYLGIGDDADGAVGKFLNANFQCIVIEDARIRAENILEYGNGVVMIVLIAYVEEKFNVAVLLIGTVRDLRI